MTVIEEVANERRRQLEVEGWSVEHDNLHDFGDIGMAGAAYASHASTWPDSDKYAERPMPRFWPWEGSWWKPKNRRHDLIRAAALIVAEIERLDRQST